MKLDNILAYKDKFKSYLESEAPFYEEYKWENLKNFQDRWDLEAVDLYTMYDQTFSSKYSGRLWGGSRNSAKAMMLEMIKVNSEFVRSSFRDLFDEDKEIMLRANRFSYHCDQLMNEVHKTQPKLVNHYHNNFKILSVYLAFRYPMEYAIYDYKAFRQMMKRLELQEIPEEYEVTRYFKIVKNLFNILSEDTALLELHRSRLLGEDFYTGESLMLVHDYYWCCTRPEYGIS